MLHIAYSYEKVFKKYEECESTFRADLGVDVPDFFDWQYVKQLVEFLKHFYEMTLRISSSQYVTANSFFLKYFIYFVFYLSGRVIMMLLKEP